MTGTLSHLKGVGPVSGRTLPLCGDDIPRTILGPVVKYNDVADLLRSQDGSQLDSSPALLADVSPVTSLHARHLVTIVEPVVRLEDLQ